MRPALVLKQGRPGIYAQSQAGPENMQKHIAEPRPDLTHCPNVHRAGATYRVLGTYTLSGGRGKGRAGELAGRAQLRGKT